MGNADTSSEGLTKFIGLILAVRRKKINQYVIKNVLIPEYCIFLHKKRHLQEERENFILRNSKLKIFTWLFKDCGKREQ